jgi:hypothetical protein
MMMRRSPLSILRDLHADRRGAIGVEFVAVIGAWILAAFMLIDVCIVFMNQVTMQDNLNRAALQASADGCFDSRVADTFSRMTSLGKQDVILEARRSTPVATAISPQHGFDSTSVRNGQETVALSPATTADCGPSGQNSVPGGYWIWLHLRYTQNLPIFGSITINRSSLVVSNSLQKP